MPAKLQDLILSRRSILLAIPFFLYIALLPAMPLMEPDEGRYSLIPQEMNTTGDYVTPRLKGVHYFEKPALDYWATALALRVFGDNAFASRLFAGLCAWGCILLAYHMGRKLYGPQSGVYAAAFLSTCLFHFALGRVHVLDMPLAFFVGLATWSGYRHCTALTARARKRWLYLLYLGSALAFLTKGLIGIVFPFGILSAWLMFERRWRDILGLVSPVGILILLAVAGPWLYLVQRANPDFLRFFFVQEHLLRYTTTMHNRYQPFYYFIPLVFAGLIPWLGFLPEVISGLRPRLRGLLAGPEILFLTLWAGLILLFFSASSSKLIPYIAPVFIPLAVMGGNLCRIYDESAPERPARDLVPTLGIGLQAAAIIALVLSPVFMPRHQTVLIRIWPWLIFLVGAQLLLTFLPHQIRIRSGRGWFASIYLLSTLFLAGAAYPAGILITPHRSAYPIVEAMDHFLPRGAVLYQFKMCAYGIDFYTGKRTPVVDDFGELRYGIGKLAPREKSRYFLTSREFIDLHQAGREFYCVTDHPRKRAWLEHKAPGTRLLWTNGTFSLLHLKPGDS